MSTPVNVLDLFAGPGGWDEALKALGRTDVLGVEMDASTCATREAAGHATISADVTTLDPLDFAPIEGLIASPPCQTFSAAGKQLGLTDPRGQLVYEVMRFAQALRPNWIACEQVKEVLPIWRMFANELRGLGYNAWAGVLNAADYGVPQIRKRAFLIATRGPLTLPRPTHRSSVDGALFGGDLLPWVTMAEALGWRGPAPDDLTAWAWKRPATTVVRSFCPRVISAPGYRLSKEDGPRQKAPGSIEVTFEQMCRLQCVDPAYPFQGSRTKRESLVGAFLPPPWAAAILAPLLTDSQENAA